MGKKAVTAILDPVLQPAEVSAAFFSKQVERAVAEQAVEIVRVGPWVTGKILAVTIGKKGVMPVVYG